MIDDSLSPVFSLRGTEFGKVGSCNISDEENPMTTDPITNKKKMNYLERDAFLGGSG